MPNCNSACEVIGVGLRVIRIDKIRRCKLNAQLLHRGYLFRAFEFSKVCRRSHINPSDWTLDRDLKRGSQEP